MLHGLGVSVLNNEVDQQVEVVCNVVHRFVSELVMNLVQMVEEVKLVGLFN